MAACRAIYHRWTLRALVAAFLDLALAYLFLCAASLAFFASKILAFVGLSLPCSCDLFSVDRRTQQQQREVGCLQGFLLDYPAGKIGGVFDSVCGNGSRLCHNGYDLETLNNNDGSGGGGGGGGAAACAPFKMDQGEESCGSVSQPPPRKDSTNLSMPGSVMVDGGDSSSCKGKNFVDHKGEAVFCQGKPPSALKRRRRHRKGVVIRGNFCPASPSPPMEMAWKGEVVAAAPMFFSGHLPQGEGSEHAISGADHHLSGNMNDLVDELTSANECQAMDKALSIGTETVCGGEKNESDIIRELKQALEEERSGRAALYIELEKERSAAASAADEAMAMIVRLQEEKAALRMEARQYQRMVEEKSMYDDEEMEILMEIIVRREREKHVLEKEVEAYKQMILGGDDGIKQTQERYLPNAAELVVQDGSGSFGSFDDPELILKEVYEFIKKKERNNEGTQQVDQSEPLMASEWNTSNGDNSQFSSMEKQHSYVENDGNEGNVLEKGMVTMEICLDSVQSQLCSYENKCSSPRLAHLIGDEDSKEDTKVEIKVQLDKANSSFSHFDNEVNVLDVHVVDDKEDLGGQGNTKQVSLPQMGCDLSRSQRYISSKEPSPASRVDLSSEGLDISLRQLELNMHKSSSDETKVGQSMDDLSRASCLDLRRSSMPAIDNERFKLENEVELLRKRLKVIQQGREKLSFSAEQWEKENYNLRRLEEISHQLQEIRKTTESGIRKTTKSGKSI